MNMCDINICKTYKSGNQTHFRAIACHTQDYEEKPGFPRVRE